MLGNYLLRTASGQYRFRLRIPAYLADELGTKEIRKSLETDSLQLATLRAARLAASYKLAFIDMKKKTKHRRARQGGMSTELITFLDANKNPVKIDFNGDAEMEIQAARELMSLAQSKFSAPAVAQTEIRLSEATRRYINEQRSRGLAERSLADYEAMLRDFVELHGDAPLSDVTRESVVKAYTTFKRLPPNRNKKPEYRNLLLHQILELSPSDTISNSTARKFASRISQFFNWCVKWDLLPKNPASGLMDKKGDESTERLPFDHQDLKQLFGSDEYQSNSFQKSYQYWAPLIGLFSGARLNEICQLRTQDVVNVNGVACFHISPNAGKLKTRASERYIPIHSHLIACGFTEFVEKRRSAGESRLFPELQPGREGPGQVASKWFSRYRKRCEVLDRKKPFHSFRHTVWTQLSRCGCPDYEIDDLIGHESQTVGSRRYRSRLLPAHLKATVEKIHFDVSELKSIQPYY